MDVQIEHLDTHEVRLTIPVADDVVTRAQRDVARKLSKDLRIPGFRPGNAPLNVVMASVGPEVFAAELANELAARVYSQVIDEAGIEPYGPGQLEDLKREPTQLIVRVPLEPVVDLKDYRSIRLPVSAVTVTDEEIEAELQDLREDNAIVEMVERPAQAGDVVEAVIVGVSEGEELLRSSRRPLVLDHERVAIPGLVDAIIGMSAGEHKDQTLTIPDDFDDERLRGKTLDLSIDVQRVSSRALPEIDDALAQAVGQFDTLAELREDLRRRLLEQKQRQADQQYASQVLDAFTNLSAISYPPAFIEDRLDDAMADFKEDVQKLDQMPFEDWLKMQGKTEQQVRDELRPATEARARRGLVMREVARAEKLDVSDAEIAAEVEREMSLFDSTSSRLRRVLQREENRRSIENRILSNKVLQRMAQIARGEADAPQEPADAAAEAISQAPLTSS